MEMEGEKKVEKVQLFISCVSRRRNSPLVVVARGTGRGGASGVVVLVGMV